jgi:hypothetical protein
MMTQRVLRSIKKAGLMRLFFFTTFAAKTDSGIS